MAYAKVKCYHCGKIHPQNACRRVAVSTLARYGSDAISGRSVAGAFLGDTRAQKQNSNWLFGVNKRKYTGQKEVFVGPCCNDNGSRRSQGWIARKWRLLKSIVRLLWVLTTRLGFLAIVIYVLYLIQTGG